MASVFMNLCVVLTLGYASTSVAADQTCKDCSDKIPVEMALRLNTIADEKQLFREFINPDVDKPITKVSKISWALAIGPDSVSDAVDGSLQPQADEPVERKAVVDPEPANCVPELQVVSLRETKNPMIIYWPECTRLEQCGGCCVHKRLSCQPIESETVNFEVRVTEVVPNTDGKLNDKGHQIVSREKHTKCKCDCIIKEKDCNERQEYRKSECRCVCTNKDSEAKCNADPSKHWNSEICSCECRKVVECSTGTYYDQTVCSCAPLPTEPQLVDRISTFNDSDSLATNRRPPPTRRRWQPNYSFLGRK